MLKKVYLEILLQFAVDVVFTTIWNLLHFSYKYYFVNEINSGDLEAINSESYLLFVNILLEKLPEVFVGIIFNYLKALFF